MKSMYCGRLHILDVVHGSNRLLGIDILGVSHETKASAPAGITIFDDHLVQQNCVSKDSFTLT